MISLFLALCSQKNEKKEVSEGAKGVDASKSTSEEV